MVPARWIDSEFFCLTTLCVIVSLLSMVRRAFIGSLTMAVGIVFDTAILRSIFFAHLRFLEFGILLLANCFEVLLQSCGLIARRPRHAARPFACSLA